MGQMWSQSRTRSWTFGLALVSGLVLVAGAILYPVWPVQVWGTFSAVGGVGLLFAIVRAFWKGIEFPLPFFLICKPLGEFPRTILGSAELGDRFKLDPKNNITVFQDGWRMVGTGGRSGNACKATLNDPLDKAFSVSLQAYPRHVESGTHYWRVGIAILDANGTELFCFHLGNPSFLCARTHNHVVFLIHLLRNIENQWIYLGIECGRTQVAGEWSIQGHVAGQSYFLGNHRLQDSLKIVIQAWSDDEGHHDVYVRDVSFDQR